MFHVKNNSLKDFKAMGEFSKGRQDHIQQKIVSFDTNSQLF
jgi:hypothetical protein